MTFADMMAMKRVSDPQISPSGRWVLFSVTDVDLAENTKTNHLWVVPMDGSAPERQVTNGTGESFGRFAPNGQFVSYTGEATKDDPYARITIATWDEKTGAIGVGRTLKAVSGDADGAVWSPDSRHFLFTTEVYPECSVKGVSPTSQNREVDHATANTGVLRSAQDDGSMVDGIEFSGTNNVAAWKTMQPAAWADEDACDKAKDETAEKNPVKAQVWDGLLYRHWDHWTGAKRTHILVADVASDNPTRPSFDSAQDRLRTRTDGAPERSANPPKQSLDGAPVSSSSPTSQNRDVGHPSELNVAIRDVTTARDVGDAETPTWMLGGPQEYAWAPDSKEIAYVTNLDAVPAASTNNAVFTLRVDEPDARPVKISTSAGSDDEPEYSPDGRWLAFRSQRQAGFESDRERLMLAERVSKSASQQVSGREWGKPKELMPKFVNWVDEFAWVPDSAAIVFASGNEGEDRVYSCNVFETNHQLSDHPIVVGIGGSGEYSDIRVVERTSGATTDDWVVAARMTVSAPSEIEAFNAGMLGHTFYDVYDMSPFSESSYRDPKETGELAEPEETIGNDGKILTHLNGSVLGDLSLPNLAYFWFTGAEGTKVEGFLLKPPGFDPAKKYPVKFLLHGGPQTAWGDAWSYRWNWELMAASGYVVIGINRRGSTGYGQKFVDEVSGDWGGRAYEDLMKGLDYAEANFPFIDRTRECALGASYGGYMADWVLTHTNRFACIVTHDGLYDATAAYGSTEEMWFPEWEFRRPEDFPKGWDGFSPSYNPTGSRKADSSAAPRNDKSNTRVLRSARDDGEKQRRSPSGMTNKGESGDGHAAEPWRYAGLPASEDPFRKWSPKEYIQNAKTPTLIIHSQKDYRLDVSQGFELYTALQRQGVPSRFLYFPDEGHWVLKPQNSELWNAVVSDWCDRWTKSGKYAEDAGE
ncbi:MAG TPA: prolyl oligopeptidase family serine peptidase [Acidobacteriaceae bacterium]|nr:prolyl oligopeptidase family serine peptidase [Acidobacteriaceae bacterium]